MSCSLAGETQEIVILKESLAYRIYEKDSVIEKYNCGYSLNETFRNIFEHSDLRVVGVNPDGEVRMVEISNHPFFLAMLFQPQFNMAEFPHPVVVAFLREAGRDKIKRKNLEQKCSSCTSQQSIK